MATLIPQFRAGSERIRSAVSVLRTRSFDSSTETGRSNERYRRAALTGITSGVSKGIRLLTNVLVVSATVGYLGGERLGLWMSLSSIIALAFGVADMGMASTLQNAISDANGKNDVGRMRRDLSSASFVMTGLPMLLFAVFLALEHWIPWSNIFNLKTPLAIHEAGPAVTIFVGCYLAAIPLGIVARVQWGFQEGVRTNAWDCTAGLLGLAGTLIAAWLRAGLPMLVLTDSGLPLLAMGANTIIEFSWRRPQLRPSSTWLNLRRARQLMHTGLGFLASSLGSIAITAAPILATGNRFGEVQAGAYALALKILTVPMMLFAIFWYPLWPAYADAQARGDLDWIRHTLRRCRYLVFAVQAPTVGALGLLVPFLVTAWTRGKLRPTVIEGLAVSLLVILVSLTTVYLIPLLACGQIRLPAISGTVSGILAFLPMLVPAPFLRLPAIPLWVAACEGLSLVVFARQCSRLCPAPPSGHGKPATVRSGPEPEKLNRTHQHAEQISLLEGPNCK